MTTRQASSVHRSCFCQKDAQKGGKLFAGIDWALDDHAVCVVDNAGKQASSFGVEHSRIGLDELISKLRKHGDPKDLPVAVERPDGRLVDRLLEAGHPVVVVQPHAIKAWREAEVVSGAKSDPGDAYVIAEYLRLCFHRLKPLDPFSDATRALRAAVRGREDLVKQRTAATNQLQATLEAFWPGANGLFGSLDSKISLAFLKRYPTAASAAKLNEQQLAGFLKKNRYSGKQTATELAGKLQNAPAGITSGAEMVARKAVVLASIALITTLNEGIRQLDKQVAAQLGEHPDAEIFTSLPRSGIINAAQMLAEWGDSRQAYDDPEAVAALAGMSPVTKKSGKHLGVCFRWACNKRFRNAMSTFASNSRFESKWAADIYDRARSRGADHPHAVRILARAWIRVVYRCWIDRVPYCEQTHKGARRFLTLEPSEAAA